jgi:hypothetical protein
MNEPGGRDCDDRDDCHRSESREESRARAGSRQERSELEVRLGAQPLNMEGRSDASFGSIVAVNHL